MLKNKKIIIIIAAVILICLVGVIIGIVVIKNTDNSNDNTVKTGETVSPEALKENFDTIFTNTTNGDDTIEVVFTKYKIEKEENGEYDVKVHIPLIDLETKDAKKINSEIKSIFVQKLKNIVKENTSYTIYSIDYVAYINDNILSLVIKAILKEGTNPQRTIIKTYNYDLDQDKIVTLEDILEDKNLEKQEIQNKILEEVNEAALKDSEVSNQFIEQGYNVFVRDINSEQYKIENADTYFIGENGHLYIIYPYGNKNFTNIKDVIVF